LICSPDDLVKLLGKIEKQEDQEGAIENGVRNLFHQDCTECLDPLLAALEGNGSLKHLKDVATKTAFERGSSLDNQPIVERFYDHPAVTSEVFAKGLISSGFQSIQEPIFAFLLAEADQDDLIAVKKDAHYKYSTSEGFKKVIDKALLIAKPGGTRFTHRDPQRAKIMMEAFNENPNMGIPTEISELIASYLVPESTLEPRIRVLNLVMNALGKDSSRRVPKEIPELIISCLSDESILESITTSFKQTISNKGTQADDSADGSA